LDLILPDEKQHGGKAILRQRHALSSSEWLRLTEALEEIDFWDLRPNDELTGAFRIPGSDKVQVRLGGKDGARWIIEGRSGRYHVVDRWSDGDDVVAVGRIFLELAQLNIPEEDIY